MTIYVQCSMYRIENCRLRLACSWKPSTSGKCKSSIKQLYRSWCWYSRPCFAVPRHFAPLVEAQHLSYNYKLQVTGYWLATHRGQCAHLPAQDAKDKVHDKKSSQDHHWHKVYKLPSVPHRVVDLFRFCLVLQTIHRFHNQFYNHREVPYQGLLLVESAY